MPPSPSWCWWSCLSSWSSYCCHCHPNLDDIVFGGFQKGDLGVSWRDFESWIQRWQHTQFKVGIEVHVTWKHEINSNFKNGTNLLEIIKVVLKLKNRLVPINLALSKFCDKLIFLHCFWWCLALWNLTKRLPQNLPEPTIELGINLIF